ncbi:MAG TPA: hypothetical protein VK427_06540 [Kofleriaceae bacterium]|nr:hypothetical protein [Kofleriaceae bacterium]
MLLVAAIGCTGGDATLGESCGSHADCDAAYQCIEDVCVNRCQRSPECGDGYSCDRDGICRLAKGQPGDTCQAETDCGPGLSCQIDGEALDSDGHLRASCTATGEGRPAGGDCFSDTDCRNGTCALGHCVDLCEETRDCASGNSCMDIPRIEKVLGAPFGGCLPANGNIVWPIPAIAPSIAFMLPIPSAATHASLVFELDDSEQRVGATRVTAQSGSILYKRCERADFLPCTKEDRDRQYYANAIRHAPERGLSVLAMPSNPDVPLETGVYYVSASSFKPNGNLGTAIPKVTAIVRIDSGGSLDLHMHFLDLDDHPCQSAFNNATLDAQSAQTENYFKQDFLLELRAIFNTSGIQFGAITYDNIKDHPDLDALDVTNAGALLSLGKYAKGVNVFFVRSLSPVGLQAFGPSPGPAGLAKTRKSGVVIGVDTLCYRSWKTVARLTAHEIARYMGLHHNVERDPRFRDPISDSNEASTNLMFYSEVGGTELSAGQKKILSKSPVLR